MAHCNIPSREEKPPSALSLASATKSFVLLLLLGNDAKAFVHNVIVTNNNSDEFPIWFFLVAQLELGLRPPFFLFFLYEYEWNE